MNKKVETEIYSLEQSVLKIVDQSRKVATMVDTEPELLEELQQIAIALDYTMQTLRSKLGLPNVVRTMKAPIEYSSDLSMTTNLPLNNKDKQKVKREMPELI